MKGFFEKGRDDSNIFPVLELQDWWCGLGKRLAPIRPGVRIYDPNKIKIRRM